MALRDPLILEDTLDDDERRVLSAFVASLKARFQERLERVSIFGSRARGDMGIDSDIDVLIVLRVEPETERQAADEIWGLIDAARPQAPEVHVPLAPLVFSLQRFNELKARERRLALDAEAEGISL